MSKDDEIMDQLQQMAENERPVVVSFGGEPGPFELPKCSPQISVMTGHEETFVLQLETEEHCQRVRIPISVHGLATLERMISHLRNSLGLDQIKQ